MPSFDTLNLPLDLVKTLEKLKIITPTPIQAKAIPVIMEGVDLLASAQTGTGKTLAYALPLVTKLMSDPTSQALILVPTRELAGQVKTTLVQLLFSASTIKIAVLIGGEPMAKQLFQLKASPRIIVGTPGRINDHLKRKSLKLNRTHFVVIDEADRMLDMGFGVQLDQINTYLPTPRQTVMFSATLLPAVVKVAQKYLKEHESIAENPTSAVAPKIEQKTIYTSSTEKYGHLLKELEGREGSVIIFVKTKRNADHLAEKLEEEGHNVEAIHGDLRQRQRDRVIKNFREHKSRILVATDIASRGLDVPHIRHVINYDLPHSPEDYIHRIGRTGRAGQEGEALCLIAPEDYKYWRAIYSLLHPGKKPDLPAGRYSSERAPSRHPRRDSHSGREAPGRSFRNDGRGGDARSDARSSEGRSDSRSAYTQGRRAASGEETARPFANRFKGKEQPSSFKPERGGDQKQARNRTSPNPNFAAPRKGAKFSRPMGSKPSVRFKPQSSR